MRRYSLVVFANLLLTSAGGCNRSSSATTASPTATSGAAVTSASLDTPSPAATGKSDQDAIRAAIQQHLAGNNTLNTAAMDMNVTQISINGDQAQADVEFRLKQGGTSMQMTYSLIRHAGGWLVTKSLPGGGQFAHPRTDQNHSGAALGAAPNPGAPAMPDVHDFFKKTPAAKTP